MSEVYSLYNLLVCTSSSLMQKIATDEASFVTFSKLKYPPDPKSIPWYLSKLRVRIRKEEKETQWSLSLSLSLKAEYIKKKQERIKLEDRPQKKKNKKKNQLLISL